MNAERGAAGRRQPDPTARNTRLTVEIFREMRHGRNGPCAVRGCDRLGVVGPSVLGNHYWICWKHLREVEVMA